MSKKVIDLDDALELIDRYICTDPKQPECRHTDDNSRALIYELHKRSYELGDITAKSGITSDPNDIHNNLRKLYEYAKVGEMYLKSQDCNNCADSKNCKFKPPLGELVRANCPLHISKWVSKKEE